MRRRSWEEKGGGDEDDLDHPVTLTEKQLRSLERNARFGLFGLILAVVALGLAGWTMFRATQKVATEPQTVAATPPPAAVDTAATSSAATAPTLEPVTAPPAAPTTVSSAPTGGPAAVIPTAKKHSVRATNAVAHRASRATHTASHSPAPTMESFEPAPAAAPPAASVPTPTPTPVPVPVEHKAAPDTTH